MEVSPDDLWTMLLSTIRYSMGRATYMPSVCADYYEKFKSEFTLEMRRQIYREITEEIARAERLGTTLGMDFDHAVWVNLSNRIRVEEKFP
jgi:hypothetical protein